MVGFYFSGRYRLSSKMEVEEKGKWESFPTAYHFFLRDVKINPLLSREATSKVVTNMPSEMTGLSA